MFLQMEPFSVTLAVPTGDPLELQVVQVSNWNGVGVVFGHKPPSGAVKYLDKKSGVYLLSGPSPKETAITEIYIGESEDVLGRLGDHRGNSKLDFWTRTHCFVSSDTGLNKGHLKFLEAELLRNVRRNGDFRAVNSMEPTGGTLGSADEIFARGFLGKVTRIAPIMGLSALTEPKSLGGSQLFLSGPHAQARGEDQPGGFLVLANSLARLTETPSLQQDRRDLRRQMLDGGLFVTEGSSLRLTRDHLFRSPSLAASVFLAKSANGRTEWKDKAGRLLRDIQDAQA
jgi:hypothetical protein